MNKLLSTLISILLVFFYASSLEGGDAFFASADKSMNEVKEIVDSNHHQTVERNTRYHDYDYDDYSGPSSSYPRRRGYNYYRRPRGRFYYRSGPSGPSKSSKSSKSGPSGPGYYYNYYIHRPGRRGDW